MYQELRQNGQIFISVSDSKYLDAEIKNAYPSGTEGVAMLNIVYFSSEEDMKNAIDLLQVEDKPSTGIRYSEKEHQHFILCDAVFTDKFGVLWHLVVLVDWDSPLVN